MKPSSKLVLDLLGNGAEGLTRAEIRQITGLSKPTVQSIIAELRDAGRITEQSERTNRSSENGHLSGGRPPERFVVTPAAGLVIGVDVGHGHIRVAVADRSGRIAGEIQEDVSIDVDGAGISALTTVVELIDKALQSTSADASAVKAVTIGIPAAIDRQGTVLFSDSLPSWATINIGDELLRLLSAKFEALNINRKMVRIENDANLGAVGEGCNGAARDARHYLYIKVSTGIGMGLVFRNRLYRGAEGAAGEFGHTTVSSMATPFLRSAAERHLKPCPRCSKLDCLENLASGQSILRQLEAGREDSTSDRQIEEVIALATSNAVEYRAYLQAIVDAGTRIGYSIAEAVRVYAPEVVVVGGLMVEAGDTLIRPIKDAVAGMKGLSAVKIRPVELERIRRSELDGAIAIASRVAAAPPTS